MFEHRSPLNGSLKASTANMATKRMQTFITVFNVRKAHEQRSTWWVAAFDHVPRFTVRTNRAKLVHTCYKMRNSKIQDLVKRDKLTFY